MGKQTSPKPEARSLKAESCGRVVFAPDVVLQVIDSEALVLKLGDETAFALNATGARIAQLIEAGLDMSVVIDRLATEYQQSRSDVERDVTNLVRVLISKGLVIQDLSAVQP